MSAIKAFFKDAVFEKEYMWFFDNFIQALCRMHINSNEVEIISSYEGEEKLIVRWAFQFLDKFYLVTSLGKLLIYDRKFEGEGTPFYKKEPSFENISGQFSAFFYNDCIWFIPQYINEKVCCFDLESEEYYEQKSFVSTIKGYIGNDNYPIAFPCHYQSSIWATIYGESMYMKYDLYSGSTETFQMDDVDTALEGICFDGERIWLTRQDSNDILCIGEQSVRIKIHGKQSYSHLCSMNDFIVVLPRFSKKVVLINKKSLEVHTVDLPFKIEKERENGSSNIAKCHETADCIYLLPHGITDLYAINKNRLMGEKIDLECTDYENEVIKRIFIGKEVIYENEDMTISNLLKYCKMNITAVCDEKEENITNGEKIWNAIKADNESHIL